MIGKYPGLWIIACSFITTAIAIACSSSSTNSGTSSGQGTVGPSGGQVATSDGVLLLAIPAGALSNDTQITISEIQSPAPGAIGTTYDIGPSGTQFSVPATLTFKYGGLDLAGNDPASLEVATEVNGAWVGLANGGVDTSAQAVTGQTTHLSPYGVHIKGKSVGNDGGAFSDGSSSYDGNSGSDAGACTPIIQQVGTCANHPTQICSSPNVFTNCVDLSTTGYSAYCCPPAL